MRRAFVASLAAICGTAAGAGHAATVPPFSQLAALYAYDATAPLALRIGTTRVEGGVKVETITFGSPKGGRVGGELVIPPGEPLGGVVFSPPSGTTREFFEPEAVELAKHGAIALLLDSSAPIVGFPAHDKTDPKRYVKIVVDLRRAVDVLVGQGVKRGHLGFVGMSVGASFGGILAGVDKRLDASVLASGGGRVDRLVVGGAEQAAYEKLVARYDPIRYVGHARPSTLFFQYGRKDPVISRKDALAYSRTGSKPSRVRWYNAGHTLNAEASADRIAWLADRLSLAPAGA